MLRFCFVRAFAPIFHFKLEKRWKFLAPPETFSPPPSPGCVGLATALAVKQYKSLQFNYKPQTLKRFLVVQNLKIAESSVFDQLIQTTSESNSP